MKTVIYTRVSTDEQAKEGYSLIQQKEKLINHCTKMNWNVIDIYTDEGISGSSIIGRPEASRLLSDAKKKKYENLLVLKTDRLSRKLKDLLEIQEILNENRIKLTILEEPIDTENDTGFAMYAMSGTFAELERKRIKARTVGGKIQKAKNGIKSKTPRIVFGYEVIDNQFVPKEPEATVVRLIFDLYNGGMTLRGISKYMSENEIYPGKDWTYIKIRFLLSNPTYKGYTFYSLYKSATLLNDEAILTKASNVVPIISDEIFDNVNNKFELNKIKLIRKHSREDFVFADVVYCGYCGRHLSCRNAAGYKENSRRCYYRCSKSTNEFTYRSEPTKCEFTSIENSSLEKMFLNFFNEQIDININSEDLTAKEIEEKEKQINLIMHNMKKTNQRKASLTEKFIDNIIEKDEYIKFSKVYSDELIVLTKQVDLLEKEKVEIINSSGTESFYKKNISMIRTAIQSNWCFMNNFEKREFINTFVMKIVLTRKAIQSIIFK